MRPVERRAAQTDSPSGNQGFSPWINWDQFVQLTVNGLTDGAVYALIALGFSIVYGILKLLNFAQGDVFMIGAFIGYFVLTGFGGPANPDMPVPLLIVLMFLFAMIGCGLLGVVIERFAYRPLRNAPRIAPLISALGVSFFLQNSALLLFGPRSAATTRSSSRTASTRSRAPASSGDRSTSRSCACSRSASPSSSAPC